MNRAFTYDFGHTCKPAHVCLGTATAGGTGDNTKVTGATIDRQGFGSAAVSINYLAALAQGATLSFAVEVQESDDGTTWGTATALQSAAIAATGGTGGSTEKGTVKVCDSYETRARYVRYNVTPDLSASGTDTLSFGVQAILGGNYNGTSLPIP